MKKQLLLLYIGIEINIAGFSQALDFTAKPGSELDEIKEKYVYLGTFELKDGMLVFDVPAGSVTTFYAK